MTAVICGKNILDSASPNAYIEKAKGIAEKIYDSVDDNVKKTLTG